MTSSYIGPLSDSEVVDVVDGFCLRLSEAGPDTSCRRRRVLTDGYSVYVYD